VHFLTVTSVSATVGINYLTRLSRYYLLRWFLARTEPKRETVKLERRKENNHGKANKDE